MRKILLATTALVGFVGAAQAAESPIAVNVGGYVDFRAGLFKESEKVVGQERSSDFTNVYQINIDASGKAVNGVSYGAHVGLSNDAVGAGNDVAEKDAYIWLSGNFGKILMGDTHSADVDLFVSAPTVGLGQVNGKFTDFTSGSFTAITPVFGDDDDNSTRVTFYTPKVGNENHKVQVGMSYTPNMDNMGHSTVRSLSAGDYKNVFGLGAQYTGKFSPVSVVVSPIMTHAEGIDDMRDYTTYGLGAQLTYAGVTFGGSYVDAGNQGSIKEQDKTQSVWTAGVKYGFDKVEVAASYLDGRSYTGGTAGTPYGSNYVRNTQEYGLGATYTWFPGMTTAADMVIFSQKSGDNSAVVEKDIGRVFMVSQKMVF